MRIFLLILIAVCLSFPACSNSSETSGKKDDASTGDVENTDEVKDEVDDVDTTNEAIDESTDGTADEDVQEVIDDFIDGTPDEDVQEVTDCLSDETSDEDVTEITSWTKQWGTSEQDMGFSVAVDSSNNIFVAGHTEGSLDGNTNAGSMDIFLTKWNADGTKAWTKQWGTSELDVGYSVAVDSNNNIFVAGWTEGSLDGNASAGSADVFLTKWNADGTKEWTKQWGTSEYDRGYSVAVDSNGNIFLPWHTPGSLEDNTSADLFLTKWNADGTKAWTKQWGTSEYDFGYSVAVDSNNNILVAGHTEGSLDGNTNAGSVDIFLTKWNADGTKAWTKQWGTSEQDFGFSVAVDSNNNIFVTGWTEGSLDGNESAGEDDIFLTKWNADGTKAWTKQWGTSEDDKGSSVAVDSNGNIFVTGKTEESLEGNTCAGSMDIFLTKWNADGTKAWTKQWGTSEYDQGSSVVLDSSDKMFVTGSTHGFFDSNTNAGKSDIFLTKF